MIQRYDVIFFYFYISKNNNTKNIFSKKDEETKKIDLISNFNYKRKDDLKENNKINFIEDE